MDETLNELERRTAAAERILSVYRQILTNIAERHLSPDDKQDMAQAAANFQAWARMALMLTRLEPESPDDRNDPALHGA